MFRTLAALALCAIAFPALAAEPRSREVTREFQRENPCPSTHKAVGTCPGYIKDHVNPLCNGGPDAVSNMQWQTVEDAKIKDRWERQICRHHHPVTAAY